MYCWRPPTCRREPDAIEVGTIRTTTGPLSSIPLMTVDHHGQGAGLRYRFEIVHRLLTAQARDRSRPGSRAPACLPGLHEVHVQIAGCQRGTHRLRRDPVKATRCTDCLRRLRSRAAIPAKRSPHLSCWVGREHLISMRILPIVRALASVWIHHRLAPVPRGRGTSATRVPCPPCPVIVSPPAPPRPATDFTAHKIKISFLNPRPAERSLDPSTQAFIVKSEMRRISVGGSVHCLGCFDDGKNYV